MLISQKCIDLIKEFEGLYLSSYKCPAGVWTIGYGTTVFPSGRAVARDDHCSKAQAEEYLTYEVNQKAKAVEGLVKVKLSQNQYDALVSFAYNVGTGALAKSALLRLLNAGEYDAASKEFIKWNKGGGKVLPGLVRRRLAEQKLFNSTV